MFKVWAPKSKSVSLVIYENGQERVVPMISNGNGDFEVQPNDLKDSFDYQFQLDNGERFADPRSHSQPQGVHKPSRYQKAIPFPWTDQKWKGILLKDYIIYELHIGTFTPEGTFEGVISKIPHLKDLGVTALELMPVIEFPGGRNWGYDGVYPFAPHHLYGGVEGLKKLINACHEQGLAVIIDVVYNHLGPEGNYLGKYGDYFTQKYKTNWGEAVNYDDANNAHVRSYVIQNALYWLTEFHADSLRLDAIHAIFDESESHILRDLGIAFHERAKELGRNAYVIAESDLNDPKIVDELSKNGYGLDAVWSDDFHHALHVLLTGEKKCYFNDFGQVAQLAKALTHGYVYDGVWSEFRQKSFGCSSEHLPGTAFVVCIQNHDQVGNAGLGKRLGSKISLEAYKLAAQILLFAPYVPLLFMGQEWNASSTFSFFTSYEDESLIQSVCEGYIKEFDLQKEDHHAVDPQNPDRFEASKLKWSEVHESAHQEIYEFYKKLIALRKSTPCLSNCRKDLTSVDFSEKERWIVIHRSDPGGSQALLVGNFSDKKQSIPINFPQGIAPTKEIEMMPFQGQIYVLN